MTEKFIESKLVKAVKMRGGLCIKFVSPSFVGVPDRIVLLPKGKVAFVETKAPGEEMRPVQVRRKAQLERLTALYKNATITIINRENVEWLVCKKFDKNY